MNSKIKTVVLILIIMIIFFIASVILIEFRIKIIRKDVSEFTARNAAASAILNGVEETVKDAKIYYSDIVNLNVDENGNIKSISTDTAKLNTVSNFKCCEQKCRRKNK